MDQLVDSKVFGLNNRIKIIKIDNNTYGILKKRKSRIIMKDGYQIEEIANAIKSVIPLAEIRLIVSGPICSKTTKYLNTKSIHIIDEE